mmetsp:Transcript_13766/g.33340  ORF Transcript_13766/g.33340 Transcript_13766/m.33340 type:complete len:240 (-) Transcript_13766:126-845(-)|eukprot:CAMPEP_0113629688 /NCGR_PEP_ID=MMETSP0017_2-20120614/15415_1 /TAXON_ID=2856 /ORGANISM="Cylindrotheca closterium" /LENGTH=239 /DNA_ID=CAMNT_0000540103 /DNA_START=32 /DNA_END=751 /DNA_ORIENTATION=- /assembly_acc=CAM_ASM_000147
MATVLRLVILVILALVRASTCFTASLHTTTTTKTTTTSLLLAASNNVAPTTTLTDETTWKLRFLLQGLPTEKGKKVNEMLFTVNAQFIEEEGYEPPQGDLQQIFNNNNNQEQQEQETAAATAGQLKITKSRWLLSEDPTERKDGLWVWGLFKEPLYPFLLLQLETERVPLPGEEEDAIKPLKLFAQLDHQREKEVGVILKGGDLKIREMETMKADPFGAATVEIYDEVTIGKISIEPIA